MFWDGSNWVEPRPAVPTPPAAPHRHRRLRDWLATLPILLLVPALIIPTLATSAGSASLSVSGVPVAGGQVMVTGHNFPKREWIQLRWDSLDLVTVRSSSNSTIAITITIPAMAGPGMHVVTASSMNSGPRRSADKLAAVAPTTSSTLASVDVAVLAATATPSPTPTPTPVATPTPAPTAAPTPAPTPVPTPTPAPTAAPTPAPTPVPTPTPAPTAAPTPAPTPVPTPTPAPTAAPTPAPTPVPTPTPAPTAAPTPAPTPAPSPTPSSTTSRYLAPNGSDSNAGTQAAPWATLGGAISKMRAGETLYVRGGTYTVTTRTTYVTVAGTASEPITIRNYPGETPVFTSSVRQVNYLYFADGARYITVSGLTFRGPDLVAADSDGESLIGFIGNASDITITGNSFYGSPAWNSLQHLVYFAGPGTNLRVTNNLFDGRGSKGDAITTYHEPNATNVVVSGNQFRNLDQGVLIWSSIAGFVIDGNTFSLCRINIQHHHSGGTTVTNNSGSAIEVDLFVGSSTNLVSSGNSW
jgi:outer membrane biosynthesis protein TonB